MVRIIVTGGTFDKIYDERKGMLSFHKSHIEEILILCKCKVEVSVTELMLKDSLYFDIEDRKMILEAIVTSSEEKIVVIHGTDTMVESALYVEDKVEENRTVVFTGAMIPYSFTKSDALFNLGAALSFVQCLHHGVHMVMNGTVFKPSNSFKNKAHGHFESMPSMSSINR